MTPRARLVIVLAGLVALAGGAASAQPVGGSGGSGGPGAPVTVLLFHPNDGVDPLGFPVTDGGADAFALRYSPLVADKERFDFPFFVADGVLPIEAIPDPSKPFASALESYVGAVEQRSAEEPAATLRLASLSAPGQMQTAVQVEVVPRTDLASEDLHLRLALVEDHVEYQPPPGLTNGVTDHRFTVRGYADLGRVTGPMNASHVFATPSHYAAERLSVAAWLQQDAPSPRFDAREVVQATQAPLGGHVVQSSKGVLVEMLSATWCDPCLYGDRAVEELAVSYGVAEPGGVAPSSRYLDLQARDALAVGAAVVLGVVLVVLARRRT